MSQRLQRAGWLAAVLALTACHPIGEVVSDYEPPQMELEEMVSYYPLEAYLNGIEGRVVVLVRIEGTGEVSDARVAVSSGAAVLDSAAQVIARVIRFIPAQVHGEPQTLWLRIPIVFALDQIDLVPINLKTWQRRAGELQAIASEGKAEARRVAQRDLLDHYVRLACKMADNRDVAANGAILELATNPVRELWKEYRQVWPLPFVLFHDFMVRYPGSGYAGLAEQYFKDYAWYEASLLEKTPVISPEKGESRKRLLELLREQQGGIKRGS